MEQKQPEGMRNPIELLGEPDPEVAAAEARAWMEEKERLDAEAIDTAGVGTEAEMQAASVPTFDSLTELATYIDGLVERPHDYGTCVYAMSMAAVATFNYVARQLQVTGFQASCADMDIMRRIRNIKGAFRITDYETLLFPQYATRSHFPLYMDSLQYHKEWLQEQATAKLKQEGGMMHKDVRRHLEWLAAGQPLDSYTHELIANYRHSQPDVPYVPEPKESA